MTNSTRTDNCEERIDASLKGRVDDLRQLWTAFCEDGDGQCECGSLADYGLSFDYVPSGTFCDQKEAYFRYQLSWGGPSDEFRFFVNPDFSCHRMEYWFLDWFDGAHRVLSGSSAELLSELWQWFRDSGAVCAARAEASRGDS